VIMAATLAGLRVSRLQILPFAQSSTVVAVVCEVSLAAPAGLVVVAADEVAASLEPLRPRTSKASPPHVLRPSRPRDKCLAGML
jgi:hypothetical protein